MGAAFSMRELLEAGAHYGHQCRRWNPKMKPYIFGERNGVHIIDLQKTARCFNEAYDFIEKTVANGGHVLFVGTKRQASELVAEHAKECGMYYVNHRWLGGALTNYNTIKQSINRLRRLEKMAEDGTFDKLPKKEVLNINRLREKLERNFGGIKTMPGRPKAIFIADAHKEHIAVKEAQKLGIPIVALTDTNADPTGINYVVPANDDSIRSLQLFIKSFAQACSEGKKKQKVKDTSEQGSKTKEGTIYDKEGHSVKVVKKKPTE